MGVGQAGKAEEGEEKVAFKERESWVRGWKEETGMSGEKRAGAEE